MRWLSLGKRKKTKTKRNKTKHADTSTHHTERRKKRERGASWHDSLLIQITYQQACRHVQKIVSALHFVFLALACFFSLCFSSSFFSFFFGLFLWWLLFSFVFESLDPTNNNTKQTASTAAVLLLLFVAAATMQYPTTSATRNPWLPVVQPRCDSGRPYQDRVARQRKLGEATTTRETQNTTPPTNTPSPSLSLSLVCSSLCLVFSVFFFFFSFFWNDFKPYFWNCLSLNLLPKRTPQISTNFHGL